MKKSILRDETGAALVLELVILAVVLAAAGCAVFNYLNHRPKPVAVTASPSPSLSAGPKQANPYAGWKSYTVSYEKLSFKYPSDWQLKADPVGYLEPATKTAPKHNFTLTAPSGFLLHFITQIEGIGGGCVPGDCPKVHFYGYDRLPSGLSLAKTGTTYPDSKLEHRVIALVGTFADDPEQKKIYDTYHEGQDIEGFLYPLFVAHTPEKYLTEFASSSSFGGVADPSSPDPSTEGTAKDYFAKPDLQTAELILRSVTFN